MNLEGSTALVTGGAVRIGRAICEELASRGCAPVIHFNNSAREAGQLKQQLLDRGIEAYSVQGRLESQADCERVMTAAWSQSGGIDILVNNAASFRKQKLLEAGGADFEAMWRINCLGPMMLTREFALRRNTAGGAVINLLDKRVSGNETGCMPYLLSKKMLESFTHNAALELAPSIRVNAVAPGAILPPPQSSASVKDLAGHVPLDYRCTPEDVAMAVAFLAESDALTGQTLFVDGGQHLCA